MKKSNFKNLWVFPLLQTSILIELETCDIKFEFYLNHPHMQQETKNIKNVNRCRDGMQ